MGFGLKGKKNVDFDDIYNVKGLGSNGLKRKTARGKLPKSGIGKQKNVKVPTKAKPEGIFDPKNFGNFNFTKVKL